MTSRGDLACKSTALTFEHDPNFSNANDFDKTGQNGVQVEGWSSKFRRSTKHHETNKWAQLATSQWTSMNIHGTRINREGFAMAWLFWGWGPHARQLCGNGHTNRRLVQGCRWPVPRSKRRPGIRENFTEELVGFPWLSMDFSGSVDLLGYTMLYCARPRARGG